MGSFYVTTPIYYVNDVPHLGTAYTTIIADAIRRYHLLRGDDTRMLTGTDEHGLKIERVAVEKSMSPHAFVDQASAPFRKAWPELGVESDDFIRTTEERHVRRVQALWQKVAGNGHLYLGSYEDWYCVGCESFKTEKELLPGNICPLHHRPVERLKEDTYFFRLSNFQKPLLAFYERHPQFIQPESRRNEVLSFVEGGLRDLSVSRTSFSWGVPVPGDPKHVMYVWFDALANYLTALGDDGDPLRRFWPPRGTCVHLVGKDILRFHAVYWPAFLLAAGYKEEELPTCVYAHGFLTIDGQKMSKSLRNAVDPVRLARELGADVIRYYLLRAVAFGQDGDFDHAALLERYNADLGKNLGNLLSRTLGLCTKSTASKVPAHGTLTELETSLLAFANAKSKEAADHWHALAPHRALEATWEISSAANQYVDRAAPWGKDKSPERVGTILATLLTVLSGLSTMIAPALPTKANEMRAQLGLDKLAMGSDQWPLDFRALYRPAGDALGATAPLFPTYDKAQERALLDKLMPKVEVEAEAKAPAADAASPPPATAPEGAAASISYDEFAKTDLRVGIVKTCERVPRKDKLLKLTVDIGEPEPRTIVAGLALTFQPDDLVGRRVVVVANLAPRDFGKGLISHGMLLASGPSEALKLATVENADAGARLK